jgi:RNA polymerase sigma-70 factor (ECF subfamily)
MDFATPDLTLSAIETHWSLWRLAHQEPSAEARAAQHRLLLRYGGAARRYLHAAVRDPEAAAELFQEFALRFLEGRLRGADPRRGRLRDFVKGVLFHLIADYHKRLGKLPKLLPLHHPGAPEGTADLADADREFVVRWRDDLLARVWRILDEKDGRSGRLHATVLRLRKEYPALRSPELAARLAEKLGKPVSAGATRLMLHRARVRFAELLVLEVSSSVDCPTTAELAEELADLGLLRYCGPALEGFVPADSPKPARVLT